MSSSILDSILDGPSVVSEQHDTSQITVEEGAIRDAVGRRAGVPSGWDASEYGITAEEAARRLDAADTPESRQAVMQDLIQRALQRASLDTSNGRVAMMSVGTTPWHGLGVVISSAATAQQAIDFAGLNWRVEKRPMSFRRPDGTYSESDDTFAIVRTDTESKLGTVGSRYEPLQNDHAFDFLDGVLGEYGAHYETAGSLFGGKKIWVLANMPQERFEVAAGDEIEPYVLFMNPHDGSGVSLSIPTTHRPVCNNTLRPALAEGRRHKHGVSIRHSGSMKAKVRAAAAGMRHALESVRRFRQHADTLVHTPCNDPVAYADDVLDSVLDISAADCRKGAGLLASVLDVTQSERELAEKRFARKIKRRGEVLTDILERHESERCNGMPAIQGSAWSAYNAVSEHADHALRYRGQSDRDSRRFESALYGRGDDMKQVAFEKALELAR